MVDSEAAAVVTGAVEGEEVAVEVDTEEAVVVATVVVAAQDREVATAEALEA